MTHRLVIGIDPGLSGAVAAFADGQPHSVNDIPTMERKTKGNEVDVAGLAALLRAIRAPHPGAYVVAVLEQVNAMPSIPGPGGQRRGMGASSAFNFGESFGAIKGVLAALGVPVVMVPPVRWKAHFALKGPDKEKSRALALQRFPAFAANLQRKRDQGRAEAMLIAYWAELTEAVGAARAAA